MTTPKILQLTALISFFALMTSLLFWIILAPHSSNFPTAAVLIIGVVPLLFPLRGLLHGKPYTYAWNNFLMLFYISHGIGELYSGDAKALYPMLELLFSSLCFISSILFIKTNAKLETNHINK